MKLDTRFIPSDNGDAAIFTQTNIAVWVLTVASGLFLAVRLWCRHRYSKLWWDDALLTFSWVCTYRTPPWPPWPLHMASAGARC